MMDDTFQTRRPPRSEWDYLFAKPLGEDTSRTMLRFAPKPPGDQSKLNLLARQRQVGNASFVSAMDTMRSRFA